MGVHDTGLEVLACGCEAEPKRAATLAHAVEWDGTNATFEYLRGMLQVDFHADDLAERPGLAVVTPGGVVVVDEGEWLLVSAGGTVIVMGLSAA